MNTKYLWFPLLIIVSLVVFFSLIKPQWISYGKDRTTLKKTKDRLEVIKKNTDFLQKTLKEFNGLSQESKDMVLGAIPVDETSDDLVAELNKSAVKSGVYISNIDLKKQANRRSNCRTKKNTSKDGAKESKNSICPIEKSKLSVSLQVNGTYEQIKDFIKNLDTQNRIISFSSSDFSKVKLAQHQTVVDAEGNEKVVENEINSVDLRINFDVFYRLKDDKNDIANLNENDAVVKELFKGKIKTGVIDDLKAAINNDLFVPVEANSAGKNNIFK